MYESRNVWEVFLVPGDSVVYQNAHEALEKQSSLVFTDFHPLLNKWFAVRLHPFHDGLYAFCQDILDSVVKNHQTICSF